MISLVAYQSITQRTNKFLNCINYCKLTDFGYKGYRYTWTSGIHNSSNILEHIDRIFANYDWLTQFPNTFVTHLPHIRSDYCPLKLEIQYYPLPRKKIFRFETI